MLPIGLCAQMACIWEATARKPGNVHRYRDFPDASYLDFLASAAAIAPCLETASERRVGATILQAIQATRQVARTNTNLGIVLLLSPLAAVPRDIGLRPGLEQILGGLDVADARAAYEAIRLAGAGGLGRVADQDVGTEPTQTLRQVMLLAAERDDVARQYSNGFAEVFDQGVPALIRGAERLGSMEAAIIFCHLQMMAARPDTLIARKRGRAEAEEASSRARQALAADWPHSRKGRAAFAELESWLCAEGNGRNPGTSADLVAASLFVALREDTFGIPPTLPWQ
jgi:triphosphoribosyl-dephospho-CoA synthase